MAGMPSVPDETVTVSDGLRTFTNTVPAGWIVGWKFEADGDRAAVLARVARQFAESRNDLCVANGPAYGEGFGLVAPAGEVTHLTDRPALFAALTERLREMEAGRTGEQTKVLAVPPAG